MEFDRQAKLVATNAHSLADLELQFGDVGLVNGPRVAPGKRSTVSNEAYLGRRLILHLTAQGKLEFPISVKHANAPDFRVTHAVGELPFEVTEACPEEEGWLLASQNEGAFPIGNYSELGIDQARVDLIEQIQNSIDQKASKEYATETGISLLIYPNSDAAHWLNLFDRQPEELLIKLDPKAFSTLYVLWGNRFIEVSAQRQ